MFVMLRKDSGCIKLLELTAEYLKEKENSQIYARWRKKCDERECGVTRCKWWCS
jgi:hypothetical protein